jgi:trimethyllysine dioxygenase
MERLARRLGYARSTIFGDIWLMEPGAADHADSAYESTALDVHTDGTYSHDAPGVIVFAQQERGGDGGDSVLVDGFAAAVDFAAAEPDAADLLGRFELRGRYVEPGVDLHADRPPLRVDADGVLRQVTFNNYDRAPVLPAAGWLDEVIYAYAAFHELISEPERALHLGWEAGEILMIDNWRLLHGRTAFTGMRTFLGCYTNHEDLESAWRLAGIGG